MSCCSIKPKDQMFVKNYGFWSFAKNMSKNIVKNICKNLIGEYSQTSYLIMLNNLQQMH